MKLLLDTHAFLWLNLEPEKCSDLVLRYCRQPETRLILSMVSVWEIQIKHQLGKLPLAASLPELLKVNQTLYGLELIQIQAKHIFHLSSLPPHHRDPFDRLLVAQAQCEALPLVTSDQFIARYDVPTIW